MPRAPLAPLPLPCRPAQCRALLSPPTRCRADQLRMAVAEALCRTAKRRAQFDTAVTALQAEDSLDK